MRDSEKGTDAPTERLQQLVEEAIRVARTARRNRASLIGLNFYADKLARLRTDATVVFQQLADPSLGDISAVAEMIQLAFAAKTDIQSRIAASRELVHELRTRKWRGGASEAEAENIFPLSLLVKSQRGYLVTIGRQMNGCFESAWYDACAVMMRRLLETVIIEAFEAKKIDNKIKNTQGDFLQLSELIKLALNEPIWNLSRNTKKALPKLRDVGHISAHSRRFTAQKSDIEDVQPHCRVAVEEFLHLAGLLDGSV
jgi:Domain of unknown function (DUF4145)